MWTSQKKKDEALLKALSEQDLPKVKSALKSGANPNLKCGNEPSCLFFAIKNDGEVSTDIALALLAAGADCLTVLDGNSEYPIHAAARRGDLRLLNALLDLGVPVDLLDKKNGAPPLADALVNSKWEAAEYLISKGCSLEVRSYKGTTPLIWALENKAPIGLVKKILASKVDINAYSETFGYAIFSALRKDQLEAVELLLARADIRLDIKTGNGGSLLHMMAGYTQTSAIAKLVLKTGLPLDGKNDSGKTPFDVAFTEGKPKALVEILVAAKEQGVSFDLDAALFVTAIMGYPNTSQVLVDAGADILLSDNQGRTFLMLAAQAGKKDTVQKFLELGLAPELKCHAGKNAFDYATDSTNKETQDFLEAWRTKKITTLIVIKSDNARKASDHSIEFDEGGGLTLTFNFFTSEVIYQNKVTGHQVYARNFSDIERQESIVEARQKLITLKGHPPEYHLRQFKKQTSGGLDV